MASASKGSQTFSRALNQSAVHNFRCSYFVLSMDTVFHLRKEEIGGERSKDPPADGPKQQLVLGGHASGSSCGVVREHTALEVGQAASSKGRGVAGLDSGNEGGHRVGCMSWKRRGV
eukprot:1159286-Pelagomonas_calceolata.AAC.5